MTHAQLLVAIFPERAISHRPEEDKRLQTDCQQFCTSPWPDLLVSRPLPPVSTEPFYRPRDPSNDYCSPWATWPWPRRPRKEGVRCTFNNIAASNHFPFIQSCLIIVSCNKNIPPSLSRQKVKRRSVGTPQQPYDCQPWGKTARGIYVCVWRFTGRLGMMLPHSTHSHSTLLQLAARRYAVLPVTKAA